MPDYFLTKPLNTKTGELPDLAVIDLSLEQAWTLAYDLLLQIRQSNPRVTVNHYCQVTRTDIHYRQDSR